MSKGFFYYKRTVAVDFDGVIHSFNTPWNPERGVSFVPDPPNENAIQTLLHYLDAGHTVCIFSVRNRWWRGRRAMKKWLKKHYNELYGSGGNSFVKRLKFPWFKPHAHILIDDRVFCFRGVFPTLQEIENFRPWNKI